MHYTKIFIVYSCLMLNAIFFLSLLLPFLDVLKITELTEKLNAFYKLYNPISYHLSNEEYGIHSVFVNNSRSISTYN